MSATRHKFLMLLIALLMAATAVGQRIKFGLYATDGITLAPGNVDELNFNTKQRVILAGSTVTINLTDEAAAVLTIDGRADLDVTVTIDADVELVLNSENKIPLSIGFAYSNLGAGDEANAKAQAIQVPAGFSGATFPLLRRNSGPPGPPPTPDHAGYVQPTARAYLFIYGILGPVPSGAAAGIYIGEINITVEYAAKE